ncbi:MAG: HAD-IA family hydrolase [Casimicrobiaceae bacterium]
MVDLSRRYELLVFDWDGTLADSTALIAGAIQQACRDMGLAVPDDMAARHVIGLGHRDSIEYVAPTLDARHHPQFTARFGAHYMLGDAAIPLFAGVPDMLAELTTRRHQLAVATGKSRRGLDRALSQHGIAHHFGVTRCADEGFPKPHPDMLLTLMKQSAVPPERTLMIGDTTHDLQLARNAGVDALAVAYGAHSSDGLAGMSPLATVHSIVELRTWLSRHA